MQHPLLNGIKTLSFFRKCNKSYEKNACFLMKIIVICLAKNVNVQRRGGGGSLVRTQEINKRNSTRNAIPELTVYQCN